MLVEVFLLAPIFMLFTDQAGFISDRIPYLILLLAFLAPLSK